MLARFGGEEFVIVLDACTSAEAAEIAEHIRSVVESLALDHEGSPFGYVTLSVLKGRREFGLLEKLRPTLTNLHHGSDCLEQGSADTGFREGDRLRRWSGSSSVGRDHTHGGCFCRDTQTLLIH
jgi:hypothetical protein